MSKPDDFIIEEVDGKKERVWKPHIDNLLEFNKGSRIGLHSIMFDFYNPPPSNAPNVKKLRESLKSFKGFENKNLGLALKTCYASWLACGMKACIGVLKDGSEFLIYLDSEDLNFKLLTVFPYPGCMRDGYYHFYSADELSKFKRFKKVTKKYFDLEV